MSAQPQHPKGDESTKIRHGRVASVDLFEIKENELELFEKGSPADIQLNFGLPLLTLAIGSIGTLATTPIADQTTKTVYIVIAVVGILLGMYLLIAWWRSHKSLKAVCKTIRQRIPSEGIEEPPPTAAIPPSPPA